MRIKQRVLVGLLATALVLSLGSVCLGADENSAPAATTAPVMPKRIDFDAATYKGETGKIILPLVGKSVSLSLWKVENGRTTDFLVAKSQDQAAVVVPAGKYKLLNFEVSGAQNGWSLTAWNESSENTPVIEVKAGDSVALCENSQVAAAMKSGTTGKIVSPYNAESISVALSDTSGDLQLGLYCSGKGRSCVVPAGKFKLGYCSTIMTAKDGTRWSVFADSGPLEKSRIIEVKPNSEVKLSEAGQLTASIEVQQNRDEVTMSLKMVAANGDSYSLRQFSEKSDAPGFQVLDKSGKVVMSGKFRYG